MAKAFDERFPSEPSFAKATDGRRSAVSIVQTLAEGRERCGGIFAVLLRADRSAKRVVEVRSALRGRDGVAASNVRLVDELLVAALDEGEAVPEEVLRLAAVVRRRKLPVGVVRICAGRVAVGDGVAIWKQRRQLRGQHERGRLATASRFPPRELARRPLCVVFPVVHVVFTLEFKYDHLVGT